MSDTDSKNNATCTPTCESESLIIEVIGKDHPEGHSFRLFDEGDEQPKKTLEEAGSVEALEDSVLHVWPWKAKPDSNIWIEIAAEKGAPIRVPFLQGVGAVGREIERQRHVVLPVIPATLISGVALQKDNPVHHVLSRAGFVYFFHEGKLWRELEVRIDENGVSSYHDVSLYEYRSETGELKAGYREVKGKGLGEIWLPARVTGGWVTIEAAFSESQWPGERALTILRKLMLKCAGNVVIQ